MPRAYYERRIIPRSIKPKDFPLGRRLGTSNSNPYGCPVCVRSTKMGSHRIEIFENGVRFRCGCIVDLPPMHDGRGKLCQVCNPLDRDPADWVDLDDIVKGRAA